MENKIIDVILEMLKILNFTNIIDMCGQTLICLLALSPYLIGISLIFYVIFKWFKHDI